METNLSIPEDVGISWAKRWSAQESFNVLRHIWRLNLIYIIEMSSKNKLGEKPNLPEGPFPLPSESLFEGAEFMCGGLLLL